MQLARSSIAIICYIVLVLPISLAVTTTHYDRAAETKSPSSGTIVEKPHTKLINLTVAERQKRLLPYINFYVQNDPYNDAPSYQTHQKYRLIEPSKINYQQLPSKFSELIGSSYQPDKSYMAQQILYQHKDKFTPFLESNALPGPFLPMAHPESQKIKVTYAPVEQSDKIPNYSVIYDKLSQLKLQQSALHQNIQNTAPQYIFTRKPQQINFIPVRHFQEQPSNYPPSQSPQSSKSFVHSYTTANLAVPVNEDVRYESQDYDTEEQIPKQQPQNEIAVAQEPRPHPKQHIHGQIVIDVPLGVTPQQNYVPIIPKNPPQTHYVVHEQKPYHNQNHKQYLQEIVPNPKQLYLISQKSYPQIQYAEAPRQEPMKIGKPIIILQPTQVKPYATEPIVSQTYEPLPTIHQLPQIVTPTPDIQTENPNSLSLILKRLQDSNALPQTLTPDNIDNSIKTLVTILSSLKKEHKLTASPIVVADEEPNYEDEDNDAGVGFGDTQREPPPGTIVESFPAHTPEGGTPGKPGIDYPALYTIPQTKFDCKTQRYKGFFADPDTHCQVWHYCDLNGGQASFLCPNGTIFSQVALTCDWWFNVKCSTTTQLYVLNERLYKYIIPLTPKFPEDYTGPLVDRYLALKFKEMEEKMNAEKKNKKPKDDNKDEIDELQLLEDKNLERSTMASAEDQ